MWYGTAPCHWPVTGQPESYVLPGSSTWGNAASSGWAVLTRTHPFLKELMVVFVFPRTERQYRDLSHCLALLPVSDRGLHKLQDNYDCFADKLQDPAVYNCFQTVLARFRRAGIKPETKVRVWDKGPGQKNNCFFCFLRTVTGRPCSLFQADYSLPLRM